MLFVSALGSPEMGREKCPLVVVVVVYLQCDKLGEGCLIKLGGGGLFRVVRWHVS